MKNLKFIGDVGSAPEDVLFDGKGNIFSGLKNGNAIVKTNIKSGKTTKIAEPQGRPLGLEWLPDGRLLICNAELGLQALDISTGKVEAYPVRGVTLHLCNNAHVLEDGTILVSDSSSKFELDDYPKDIIQNTSTGRLIKIAPDGEDKVIASGLCFANGVAYLASRNAALVAQTGRCCIEQVDLATGTISRFADIDGHPDNISIGSDGRIWVAVPSNKNNTLAFVHKLPLFIRKLVSLLPPALQPKPKPKLCCRVEVFDQDGNMVEKFEGDTGVYSFVTGVREHEGLVAMGSIEQDGIATFEI